MDSPNANAKTITMTNGSSPPTVIVCSGPASQPCSNTAYITPKVAPSDTTLARIAFTGTTSEPVNANSSSTMASSVTPTAQGRPRSISPIRSTSTAASPVTQDSTFGG